MEHCSFFQIIQFLTTVEQTKSAKKRLVLVATPRVSRDAPGIVATNVVEVQKPVETWLLVGCWWAVGEDGLVLARSKDLRNG